jgi:hypothetical protein
MRTGGRRSSPRPPHNAACLAGDLEVTMSATDELLRNNEAFAAGFESGDLPIAPANLAAHFAPVWDVKMRSDSAAARWAALPARLSHL